MFAIKFDTSCTVKNVIHIIPSMTSVISNKQLQCILYIRYCYTCFFVSISMINTQYENYDSANYLDVYHAVVYSFLLYIFEINISNYLI